MSLAWLALLLVAVPCKAMTLEQAVKPDLPDKDGCWKNSYGRGVGIVPMACRQGFQLDGLLCYPYCQGGYTGVGPVCWQNCPNGWRDDGAFCFKPPSYGRGAGYISRGDCESRHGPCEMWGLLWYPVCADGFYPAGCCVCSPVCPSGMTDIGVSCAKHSYGRGVGEPTGCPSDMQYDAGLCYYPCQSTHEGVGPVCWQRCPAGTQDCGALCVESASSCTSEIRDMATAVIKAVVDLYLSLSPQDAAQAVLDLLLSYGYPIC